MLRLALKMLIGDRAKYIGIILGLSFASFIITQQTAIFIGLMKRTYGFVTDTSQPQIWVVNPEVQNVDDIKPLKETDLFRVRGIHGVEWAVPMFKQVIRARLPTGAFQNCILIGIDDATLIGGPPRMVTGSIKDLRKPDGIIVNKIGANDKLSMPHRPLMPGDTLELNDHRASVVGICDVSRTFQSQPVIYTTFSRATAFIPPERKLLSFILVHALPGTDLHKLCATISQTTRLAAYTARDMERLTVDYYMRHTGIPINFGVAVLLGLIIGTAIAGQTFNTFIRDNLRYLGLFKAVGATERLLINMTLLQVFFVGSIGWGIGTGAAAFFGFVTRGSELSFALTWQLYLFSGISMFAISLLSAMIAMRNVYKLEPAIVFKS